MADATVAIDRLKALEIALNLAAEVTFDRNFIGVDRDDDGVQLFRRKILGTDVGIDVGLFENFFRVAGAHAVNIRQGGFDAFVAGNVYSK